MDRALARFILGDCHGRGNSPTLAGWIVAFLGFRLFDILKPGPVGWADRRGDALGIMLDDVIAGLLAALPVLLAVSAVHGLFHP